MSYRGERGVEALARPRAPAGAGRRSARAARGARLGDRRARSAVCSMSRSRCSPRRVWFSPTTAGAGERRAAEREQVLGHVVEQHRDVRRPTGGQPVEEEVRPPARLGDVLAVGPDPVLEPDRRPVRDRRIGGVAAQQRGRIRGRQRRLPGRRRGPARAATSNLTSASLYAGARHRHVVLASRRHVCGAERRRNRAAVGSGDGAGLAEGGDLARRRSRGRRAAPRRCARRPRAPCPARAAPRPRPSPGTGAGPHRARRPGTSSIRSRNCGSSCTRVRRVDRRDRHVDLDAEVAPTPRSSASRRSR